MSYKMTYDFIRETWYNLGKTNRLLNSELSNLVNVSFQEHFKSKSIFRY